MLAPRTGLAPVLDLLLLIRGQPGAELGSGTEGETPHPISYQLGTDGCAGGTNG